MSQLNRRTTLLSDSNPALTSPRTRQRHSFAEFSGGAAAECAAVCCCCPFTVIYLMFLAVYKVPAGVCRKALARKKERQRFRNNKKKEGVLVEQRPIGLTRQELEMEAKRVKERAKEGEESNSGGNTSEDDETSKTVDLLEKEMWSQFNETGFFRSRSQRLKS